MEETELGPVAGNSFEGEQLYSSSELLQIIYGLTNVYWSKSWLGRILYKPWYAALQTLAMIIAGDKLLEEAETEEMLDNIENFLNE